MIYLAAILALGFAGVAIWLSGLVPASAKAMVTSRSAVQTMLDGDKEDEEKERILQQDSLKLIGNLGSILLRGVVVIAASLLPLVVFDKANLASISDSTALLMRWDVILVASIIATLIYLTARKVL
ncbi:MAG: hypothetical protein ACR2PF_13420 [Rhizobiaceae bacterium]